MTFPFRAPAQPEAAAQTPLSPWAEPAKPSRTFQWPLLFSWALIALVSVGLWVAIFVGARRLYYALLGILG